MPLQSILADTKTLAAPPFLPQLAAELEGAALEPTPDAVRGIVSRAFEVLKPRRAVLTSALGMEGCALLDMVAPLDLPLSVVFLDTGFNFDETLELFARLEKRYPTLKFETQRPRLTPSAQEASEGPELWRRSPDRCCHLRKVEPLETRLAGVDLWLTAITRSQSPTRAEQTVLSPDLRLGLTKLAPLAGWTRKEVWRHVETHHVPFNPLHLRGFPTVSCRPCTVAVPGAGPSDYSRAGRWAASAKTECGLHGGASGKGSGHKAPAVAGLLAQASGKAAFIVSPPSRPLTLSPNSSF